jgi:hypothetical protein
MYTTTIFIVLLIIILLYILYICYVILCIVCIDCCLSRLIKIYIIKITDGRCRKTGGCDRLDHSLQEPMVQVRLARYVMIILSLLSSVFMFLLLPSDLNLTWVGGQRPGSDCADPIRPRSAKP